MVPHATCMAVELYFSGTILVGGCLDGLFGGWLGKRAVRLAPQKVIRGRLDRTCDAASSEAGVMLRLRFCYVSKAAILTVPVPHVPVENRSPA